MHEKEFDKLMQRFENDEVRFANKALDFMDGKQLHHVVQLLDHPTQGRRQWKQRGMRASYRNLTGMIIEKSGLLFMDGKPDIVVKALNGDVSNNETELLHEYLKKGDFATLSENLDQVVRLLKTAIVLTQYNSDEDEIYFDILHRGNCVVDYDTNTKMITRLIYKYDMGNDTTGVRIFTPVEIEDWVIESTGKRYRTNLQDNMYQHIPATVFYDTKIPRYGFWCNIPKDLVLFNEEYNLYLIDTLFAASYANRKTLFTNAKFNVFDSDALEVEEFYGDPLPRQTMSADGMVAGPDRQVELDTTGVENVFLEYKGPDIRLEEIRQLFMNLTRDIASDWCVRIKIDGEGTANSGFQVIVEETDNLELRKRRGRLMEAGLERFFKCISEVINTANNRVVFREDADLNVEFPKPSLPVDIKQQDEIWIQRIEKGLASHVDYFMSVKNMSEEEAINHVNKLKSMGSMPMPSQEQEALLKAYLSKAISHETYLNRVKEAGLLPMDRDVQEEIMKIENEGPLLDESL